MKKLVIAGAVSTALLTGCFDGSSSSTSSVTGIVMPSTMSVVTAQDSGGGVVAVQQLVAVDAATFSNTTDYKSDKSRSYVYDSSMEPLETVNMILCLMEQTRASDMVNQGAYTALIDEDKCEQGSNQSSSGDTGQSSSKVSQLNKWVIESTRTSNSSPQIVKMWVPPMGGGGDGSPMDMQRIMVEVEAREGVSASKPFGDFILNFKGVVDAGLMAGGEATGVDSIIMAGTLKTDEANPTRFQFIEKMGDALSGGNGGMFSRQSATDVILDDAAGTSGKAVTSFSESFTDPDTGSTFTDAAIFSVAFNADYLLRDKDSTTQVCTDRNAFNTQTWRYNLYHHANGTFNGQAVTAGERVALNSGFPFKTAGGAYGHMSYWGAWLENGSISDGDTITRFDFGSDTTTDYTVNIAPGKMIRRSANSITMDKLLGEQLYYWGEDPGNPGNFGQWLVEVNAGTYAFEITGSVQFGDNGPQITTITPVDISPSTDGQNLWLWSDSLGGNITYVYSAANAVSATASLTFYAEGFVYPDGTLANGTTLYCYDRCLKGGVATVPADDTGLFYPTDGTQYTYTVNVAGGKVTLTDNTAAASVDMSGLNLSNLGYDWGIQSGEMVTDASGITDWWDIYNAPVSLRWESGTNEWNKLTTVTAVSDSSLVSFDKPLALPYTHATANDANASASHDGRVFLLQYGGEGELWGFPWKEDADTKRWYSPVTLKDGTVLSDGTNEFVVKAIESEQTMKLANQADASDITACNTAGLSVANLGITVPTTVDGVVSIDWADRPTVTAAPAVIEGETQ